VFERTEDMLDSTPADRHCIWLPVEPSLHGIQYMFVLPSFDAAIVAGRTSVLEVATGAGTRPVRSQGHVMLDGVEPMNGALAGRASIYVASCLVDKVGLREETFLP
jgi:hypothetical protein